MKHVFIINPKAGKGNGVSRIYAMAEKLRREHGLTVECMLTQSAGHATTLTRAIAQTGEEVRFYACGGDGTVNEVAGGIVGCPNAAMTAIPIGTGNDFLKNFGADAKKFADAENLFDGPVKELDLIDCNGRPTVTVACSGIDARIAADVHRYSTRPLVDGKTSYLLSAGFNFIYRGIGEHWTVYLDGEEQAQKDYSLIAVCNGRHYGGGFMPMPEASMTDGVLNTILVDKVSRATFATAIGDYMKGKYKKHADILKTSAAKEIRIVSEGEDIVTCLDGEIVRNREVCIRLSEYKLRFFGPEGFDPDASRKAE